MTVAELRAALSALPADADTWTVVLSRDSEGNGFSPLRDVGRGNYLYHSDFLDEGDCLPDAWHLPPLGINAVCLWPVR